jgi:uncharacterized membrane protein
MRASRILSLIAAAGACSAAMGQSYRYDVSEIVPLPGHSILYPNAINSHGTVVGWSMGSPVDNQSPWIWTASEGTRALPKPPGYLWSAATDINDAGVIVGYAQPVWSAEQSMVAWKYENGQFTIYPGVGMANNINNSGAVVGRSCLSGANLTCYFMAEPGQSPHTVGPANFYSSSMWRFIDVNDGGQIVYTPPGATGAATRREPNGTLTLLPPPPSPYVRTYTWAINNSGQVTGRYEYNIGSEYFSKAFIWSPEAGLTYVGIPNYHVRPKGLNNLGQVVGETGANESSYLDTWVWTPERGNENLDALIDPTAQIVTTRAYGINDAGQIIGNGSRLTPPFAAIYYVLTPVGATCYANCDGSTSAPVLNVNDFQCFLTRYAAGDPYANCDESTVEPTLNVNDFHCFLNKFAAGCP